jgi:hypothetical protein
MSTGGGMTGPVGQVIGQVQPQAQTSAGSGGAAYTLVQQGPVYQPQYQQYQPQQRMAQPQYQMPNYQSGLQAAMMQIMQQYNRPMMRPQMQQGLTPYNSPALNYKPNMSNITANLNRVAPSVELQQKLAAEQAAKEKAEKDAYDAANQPPSGPYYDGAGG